MSSEYRISFVQLNEGKQTNCIRDITLQLNRNQLAGISVGILVLESYYKPHPIIRKNVSVEAVLGVIGGKINYNDLTERIESLARNKTYLVYVDTTSASSRIRSPEWREKASTDPNELKNLLRLFSNEPLTNKKYLCFVNVLIDVGGYMDRQVYIYHFDSADFWQGLIGYLEWNNIDPKSHIIGLFQDGLLIY